jgi:hypothetical protein
MLKRHAYDFTLSTIYCYAYVDETDGNFCMVYVWNIVFISARSIQNSEFADNAYVCVFMYGLHISRLCLKVDCRLESSPVRVNSFIKWVSSTFHQYSVIM